MTAVLLKLQVLTTRKRKDADESTIKVHVCIYAFDLLYLNGEVRYRIACLIYNSISNDLE